MSAIGSVGQRLQQQARAERVGRLFVPDPVADLEHYLESDYQWGEPDRVNSSELTATGFALADRFVSRLEIASAMRLLRWRQREIIALLYRDGLSQAEVCRRLRIGRTTLHTERLGAISAMAEVIYDGWKAA